MHSMSWKVFTNLLPTILMTSYKIHGHAQNILVEESFSSFFFRLILFHKIQSFLDISAALDGQYSIFYLTISDLDFGFWKPGALKCSFVLAILLSIS